MTTTTGWADNWPVGLKTSRYFTRPDFTTGPAQPDACCSFDSFGQPGTNSDRCENGFLLSTTRDW